MKNLTTSAVGVLFLLAPQALAQDTDVDAPAWGHSSHGAAYDAGPRQKPWRMEGVGTTPFPITSANAEVQVWFDQGIALMHGFWYYEAERSFRWCLKLDPECAMAYWGMSLATKDDSERSAEFLEKAVARKDGITPRERDFISVSEAFAAAEEADDEEEAELEALAAFDRLLMDYPDDVEAKALYWLNTGWRSRNGERIRYGMEAVLDDILELNPEHVGAHHYRIHNWDGKEGRYAVDSCMVLGDLAPNCGHLLHMPGHVLSGIGMWHEAAIAMDRATRVEKAYMNERMIVPEDNWDYVHNLDYLCYIQEQLGMVDQALVGAEQLLLAPAFTDAAFFSLLRRNAKLRALVKFERWDDVLALEWDEESEVDQLFTVYARFRAHLGLGDLAAARELHKDTKKQVAGAPEPPGGGPGPDGDDEAFLVSMMKRELGERMPEFEALLLLAEGEYLDGLARLAAAAESQVETWENDPPREPVYLYNLLGDEYLKIGAARLAAQCYERTLETVMNDGFAYAGMVVAYSQLGAMDKAEDAMAKLQVIWSDADRPNRWLAAAEATGVTAEPRLESPVAERNYKTEVLDRIGPSLWVPGSAPALTATNAAGEKVSLEDYRGQSVLAIFYLGDECVHCIEQIMMAEERLEAIGELGAVVLAISKDSVEEIAVQSESLGVTLLSDTDFVSARRFNSYDDFEEIELHSTFLIDPLGRVHWSRIGGDPFTDFDFLESELARLQRQHETADSDEDGTLEAGSKSAQVPVPGGLRR